MLTTAPVDCLIRGRNCMNTSGSGVGRPSFGSRAWRCRIAAPASAAAIASRAISSGVSGRYGLIVGVWIDPVTAQVMTTLPRRAIFRLPSPLAGAPPRAGRRKISFRLAPRPDKRLDLGVGLGLPPAAVEHPIMADFELKVVRLFCLWDPGTEIVRGDGLPDRANIVLLAFDGHQCGAFDRCRIDPVTAHPQA